MVDNANYISNVENINLLNSKANSIALVKYLAVRQLRELIADRLSLVSVSHLKSVNTRLLELSPLLDKMEEPYSNENNLLIAENSQLVELSKNGQNDKKREILNTLLEDIKAALDKPY